VSSKTNDQDSARMIDKSYTDLIRHAIDTGGEYVGSLYTDEELDHLMLGDDDVNEDFTIKLAEEAFYRQNGFHVDMRPQGDAIHALANITGQDHKEKQHNVYVVNHEPLKDVEIEDANDGDAFVAKVTPFDVNAGVRSLEYHTPQPTGASLQRSYVSREENPIEAALFKQLSFAQTLDFWGADVNGLYEFIDKTFGITFSKLLVEDYTFANVNELSTYIASGGRPSPQSYLSMNVISKFHVVEKPRYTQEDVGSASIFWSRNRRLCQHIIAMSNSIRGMGAIPSLEFAANPSYFSQFNPNQVFGKILTIDTVCYEAPYAKSISHKENIVDFCRSRGTLGKWKKEEIRTLISDVKVVEESMHITTANFSLARLDFSKEGFYDDFANYTAPRRSIDKEGAAPSKIASVLNGLFNGEVSQKLMMEITTYTNCLLVSACTRYKAEDPVLDFHNFNKNKFFHNVMFSVNIIRAYDAEPRLKELVKGLADPYKTILAYLYSRHVAHDMITIKDGVDTANTLIKMGKVTTKMKGSGIKIQYIAGYPRGLKLAKQFLAMERNHMPFSRYSAIAGQAHKQVQTMGVGHYSIFDSKVAADNTEEKSSYPRMFAKSIGKMRDTWVTHYNNICKTLGVACATYDGRFKPYKIKLSEVTANSKKSRDHGVEWLLYAYIFIEYCLALGRILAYEFYQVHITYDPKGKDIAEMIDNYLNDVNTLGTNGIMTKVKIDGKVLMFNSKSAVSVKMEEFVMLASHEFGFINNVSREARLIIMDSYMDSDRLLKYSVKEIFEYDQKIRSQNIGVMAIGPEDEKIDDLPLDLNIDKFFTSKPIENVALKLPPHIDKMVDYLEEASELFEGEDDVASNMFDRMRTIVLENYTHPDIENKDFIQMIHCYRACSMNKPSEVLMTFHMLHLKEFNKVLKKFGVATEGKAIYD
jgi:hypothetical protein